MHRLRHPIRSITEPYGKAGLTVAILALVLATTGAAFAAAGLNPKQKKEVTKIAKKYAGKPGAPGTAGTNGTNGKDGPPGQTGAPGESVTIESYAGSECEQASGEAGAKFTNSTGTAYACDGSAASYPATLPPGRTETGLWAMRNKGTPTFAVVNYPLRLDRVPNFEGADHLIKAGSPSTTACPGSAGNPKAAPGQLCIYVGSSFNWSENLNPNGEAPDPSSGWIAVASATNGEEGFWGRGSWAVTACEKPEPEC